MMRIVQLTTVHSWNDVRVFQKIACSLSQAGYDVHVIAPEPDGKPEDEEKNNTSIHFVKKKTNRLARALFGFRAVKLAASLKPKVVQFHDPELIPYVVLLRLVGIKVIYDVHEDLPQQVKNKYWIPKSLRKLASVCCSATELVFAKIIANYVIAVTPHIEKRFPKNKTILLRNFPSITKRTLVDSIDIKNNQFVYVGGINEQRGIVQMVESVGRASKIIECTLCVAGSYGKNNTLEQKINAMDGSEHTEFTGWVDRAEINKIYSQSFAGLVVLHPTASFIWSYPTKLFEYMAAGLPIIASKFDEWENLLSPFNCCLFVDPKNTDEIAEAMLWLLANPTEARKMGTRGRIAAEKHFNWSTESKKLLLLYSSII